MHFFSTLPEYNYLIVADTYFGMVSCWNLKDGTKISTWFRRSKTCMHTNSSASRIQEPEFLLFCACGHIYTYNCMTKCSQVIKLPAKKVFITFDRKQEVFYHMDCLKTYVYSLKGILIQTLASFLIYYPISRISFDGGYFYVWKNDCIIVSRLTEYVTKINFYFDYLRTFFYHGNIYVAYKNNIILFEPHYPKRIHSF
jgi:hypothetical protein